MKDKILVEALPICDGGCFFIFTFTQKKKVRYKMKRYNESLKLIEQGKKYDKEAVFAIAKAGEGSIRDALSVADTALSYNTGKLTYEDVTEIIVPAKDIFPVGRYSVRTGNYIFFFYIFAERFKSVFLPFFFKQNLPP